ncbi:murein biosynthesis integral membrane protein MurJ [Sporosarcina luteola]|uniref:murein biosynthesis integral membrane protein MurJ n=1 Tax=Sporosarcina luteola TaxID=582850 RepID=UPI0020406BD6|nr:murein biosynthesis integral membrane protein MurJ [Sporosarcina luteola]MCM3711644.1 murein biosynthesis integral membrane protein MurJ [Sporosarcina luteola]
MKKTALILMVIAVLSKITGFLRDITLSFFYGATSISDVYIISITITSVLFSLIILGVSTAYIPMFKQIEHEKDHHSASVFTNNLLNIVLLITTVVIIIGLCFSHVLVKIFALGFDGETLKTAVLFTRIGLLSLFFTSLTQLFISYLQLKGKFIIPAMVGLPFNIIIMISIFIGYQFNMIYLAIGSVFAAFVQLLFLLPSIRKTDYQYIPILNFADKDIKKLVVIIIPVMIGISIDQINLMVDKTLASTLIEGGISALTYASRLNDFVQGIFVLSFVAVMFPLISNMAAEKKTEDFKASINDVTSSVILIVVPASIGIMILAEPIIRLLFGHGHFDEHAVEMTSHALFFYSIGMIGYGFREVLNRTFYSLQDSKTPMYNASISVALNIVLSLLLSSYMGIGGIALATSISALFCSILLAIHLRRKIGSFGLKGNLVIFIKATIASTVMGLIVYILNEYLLYGWNEVVKMMLVVCIGSVVYLLVIILFRGQESKKIINFFKSLLRKLCP